MARRRFSWKPEFRGCISVAKGAAVTGHEDPLSEDSRKGQLEIVPVSSTGTAVFLAA